MCRWQYCTSTNDLIWLVQIKWTVNCNDYRLFTRTTDHCMGLIGRWAWIVRWRAHETCLLVSKRHAHNPSIFHWSVCSDARATYDFCVSTVQNIPMMGRYVDKVFPSSYHKWFITVTSHSNYMDSEPMLINWDNFHQSFKFKGNILDISCDLQHRNILKWDYK